jgi:hypothetical protein
MKTILVDAPTVRRQMFSRGQSGRNMVQLVKSAAMVAFTE